MGCKKDEIRKYCTCTYDCNKKGICCECIKSHLKDNELPGCVFAKIDKKAEASYDRSFKHFAKLVNK